MEKKFKTPFANETQESLQTGKILGRTKVAGT